MPSGSSGSGLDSLSDKDDSLIGEVVIRVDFLACAEFTLGLILSEIAERETGYSF